MQLLEFEHATLRFTKTGTGAHALIVFHGFGQSGQIYQELATSLSDSYTLYLIDLFFHGGSVWKKGEQPLEKDFWQGLITRFLSVNNLDTFSVLGYSMGGKFALATLESFPGRVKEVFLLAPDGVKTNGWYSMATYPLALRRFFKSMIKKPERFNALARFAFGLRLIDKGILRFVELQMNTEEKRQRVYMSWVVFRHLRFDMKHISGIINRQGIRLTVIIGKFDKVITAKNMSPLIKRVPHAQLILVETGHTGIIAAAGGIIKSENR